MYTLFKHNTTNKLFFLKGAYIQENYPEATIQKEKLTLKEAQFLCVKEESVKKMLNPKGHQIKLDELKGQYSELIASSSKERKRLSIINTIDQYGLVETKFDVRLVNTHHEFSNILDALNLYNKH